MVRFLAGLFCAFSLVSACSSDDAADDGNQPYEPAGNGVAMSESDACKSITAAEDDRRAALSCGPVTRPPCPVYIQKSNPACSQYDQGTVQACAAFVGEQPTCDALTQKKCLLKILPGSAPNGC